MPLAVVALVVSLFAQALLAQEVEISKAATLLSKDNQVDVARPNSGWSAANEGESLNVGDRLRTGEDSRAKVRLGDGSVLQLDELTTIEIKPPQEAGGKPTLSLPGGAAFFFSRGKSREVRIETPSANGAIRGTAFLLKVNPNDGRTSVSMMEGEFELSNIGGVLTARKGEQAEIAWGSTPVTDSLDDRGDSAPWYLVIENRLPSVRILETAGRLDFFGALPAVTRQWRFVAPQLAGAATIARTEWAKDILESSFRVVGPDCPLLARVLASIIAVVPSEASRLTERAIELFPECAGAFDLAAKGGKGNKGFAGGPPPSPNSNFGNPPGGNSVGSQGNVVTICHNLRTIFVSPEDAQNHLQNHPGDTLGACQVTPVQNP